MGVELVELSSVIGQLQLPLTASLAVVIANSEQHSVNLTASWVLNQALQITSSGRTISSYPNRITLIRVETMTSLSRSTPHTRSSVPARTWRTDGKAKSQQCVRCMQGRRAQER